MVCDKCNDYVVCQKCQDPNPVFMVRWTPVDQAMKQVGEDRRNLLMSAIEELEDTIIQMQENFGQFNSDLASRQKAKADKKRIADAEAKGDGNDKAKEDEKNAPV